jgi:hypothetical protein
MPSPHDRRRLARLRPRPACLLAQYDPQTCTEPPRVPAGADPEINDIGYYRPTNGLVFYYGDVGYLNGIVRIGRLSAPDMQFIQSQSGSFPITVDAT